MSLSWTLWLAMVVYGAVLMRLSPRVSRPDQFFRGRDKSGRDIGVGMLIASVVISWIFAKSITNAANLGRSYGFVGAVAYAGWYLSIPVAGVVIWWIRTRTAARSLPEFLSARYGNVATVAFLLVILVRLMNEVWSNTAVVGAYFGAAGTPLYFAGAVAFTVVTLAYSLRGGLRSSIITDVVQMGLAAFLLVFVLGLILPRSGAAALLSSGEWSMKGGVDLLLVALIQSLSYPFHDPVLTDRAFLIRPRAMLFGYLLAGAIAAAFIALFGLTGAHAMLSGIEAGQDAPLRVAQAFGVAVMLGMTVLMMVSAGSTLDSTLSSCAKALTIDLAATDGPNARAPISKRLSLWMLGQDTVALGRRVMMGAVVLGTIPLFMGTAILKATTVSGTMVLGLAPPFLLFTIRAAGRWAFHMGFWPGVLIGVLHAINRIPTTWAVGDGPYAALLGANLVGTAIVFAGFGLGTVMDMARSRSRGSAAAAALLVLLFAGTTQAQEEAMKFDLGGQAMLRLTSRFQQLDRPSAEVYNIRLIGRAQHDPYSFLVELRFRQTKLRSYSPSNVWLQQAYGRWSTPLEGLTVSAGLLYNQLGLFWDGAWFGNLAYLNGHKLDPDMNLEVAFHARPETGLGLSAWLQLSPGEDGLNGSFSTAEKTSRLRLGTPDLEVDTNYREALALRARLLPSLLLGALEITPGASIQVSRYDQLVPVDTGDQLVWGVECGAEWHRLQLFGENLTEEISNLSSERLVRDYWLGGVELALLSGGIGALRDLSIGSSFQRTDYPTEAFDEWFLTSRVAARVNSLLGVTVEYVRWQLSDKDRPELDRIEFILHFFY